MVGSAVLTTEMSSTTRICAVSARASTVQGRRELSSDWPVVTGWPVVVWPVVVWTSGAVLDMASPVVWAGWVVSRWYGVVLIGWPPVSRCGPRR